jgi:hypothetical protein
MLDIPNSTFLKTLNHSEPLLFMASFYCLTLVYSVLLLDSMLLFNSLIFVRLFSVRISQCIFCSDTTYSRYFEPINTTTNRQSINIIQCHLFLSIRRDRPITIIDVEGYPEPISPYGLSRWQDTSVHSTAPCPFCNSLSPQRFAVHIMTFCPLYSPLSLLHYSEKSRIFRDAVDQTLPVTEYSEIDN